MASCCFITVLRTPKAALNRSPTTSIRAFSASTTASQKAVGEPPLAWPAGMALRACSVAEHQAAAIATCHAVCSPCIRNTKGCSAGSSAAATCCEPLSGAIGGSGNLGSTSALGATHDAGGAANASPATDVSAMKPRSMTAAGVEAGMRPPVARDETRVPAADANPPQGDVAPPLPPPPAAWGRPTAAPAAAGPVGAGRGGGGAGAGGRCASLANAASLASRPVMVALMASPNALTSAVGSSYSPRRWQMRCKRSTAPAAVLMSPTTSAATATRGERGGNGGATAPRPAPSRRAISTNASNSLVRSMPGRDGGVRRRRARARAFTQARAQWRRARARKQGPDAIIPSAAMQACASNPLVSSAPHGDSLLAPRRSLRVQRSQRRVASPTRRTHHPNKPARAAVLPPPSRP